MPSNGSSAHTQPEYSVVAAGAGAAAAPAAVVVGATAAAVFSHATLSFKCPCVRYNAAARTQPGHFTCHSPPPPPPPFLACPAPRQLWILMAAASHVESPSSVAAAHSRRHTPPPSPAPAPLVVPRLAACIRDGIASCFHVVVVAVAVACLVAILISPAAQRRIF